MKPRLANFWHQHRERLVTLAGFGATWAVATIIFYSRYQNALRNPNFFAEDGMTFTKNLLDHGLWESLMLTFNGYYVWGLYLLNELALGLNALKYGGNFEAIPKAIAMVSYAFLGLCAALPVMVLRRQLGLAYLVALTLLLAYVPMPGSDYAIIGTLGNLKFAFVFVAFMLLLARIRLKCTNKLVVAIDLGLVVCAYTSVIVYALLPIILLQDGLRPKDWWTRNLRGYLRSNWALWSTVGLGIVLLWQVFIVATHGIPPLPGYMDEPFNRQRSIEIFGARAYLYGVAYGFYEQLNDGLVLVVLASVAVLASLKVNRRNRTLFWFAVYAVAVMTGLFVANRTGVSVFFPGYKAGPVDQFFYSQNMIFDVALVVSLAGVLQPVTRGNWGKTVAGGLLCWLVLQPIGLSGSYGTKTVVGPGVSTIHNEVVEACAKPGNTVAIEVYPAQAFVMKESRAVACKHSGAVK